MKFYLLKTSPADKFPHFFTLINTVVGVFVSLYVYIQHDIYINIYLLWRISEAWKLTPCPLSAGQPVVPFQPHMEGIRTGVLIVWAPVPKQEQPQVLAQ